MIFNVDTKWYLVARKSNVQYVMVFWGTKWLFVERNGYLWNEMVICGTKW